MRGEKLVIIALTAILTCSLSSENAMKIQRAVAPPSPGNRRGPPTPPHVDPEFITNCRMQKRVHSNIRCEENGSFSEIQCMGDICFCADTITGRRINDEFFSMDQADNVTCSSVEVCPMRTCSKVCRGGYKLNRNKCRTCKCKAPPVVERCISIRDLVTGGNCSCPCIIDPSLAASRNPGSSVCPYCNTTCSPNANDTSCAVMRQDQCALGTNLKSVGRHARTECLSKLLRNNMCKPALDQMLRTRRGKLDGASRRGPRGELGDSPPLCGEGLTCTEVSLKEYECEEENTTGVCVMERQQDPYLRCDSDGSYLPLQCRPMPINGMPVPTDAPATHMRLESISHSMPHECHCVLPNDGRMVAGSMRRVRSRRALPNCEIEEKGCRIRNPGRRLFEVSHGENYFDANKCRTCQCRNGNAKSLCSLRENCTVVMDQSDNFTASDCMLSDSTKVIHGKPRRVGCELCGCRNGRLRCTEHKRCKKLDGGDDKCGMCIKGPSQPVCGPGARNHLSRCTATQCAGIPEVELWDGPCQSQDACAEYPCTGENQVCLNRKGTVACMGQKGCRPHQLRTCVDVNRISCPVVATIEEGSSDDLMESDDEDSEFTEVCGTDQQTYQSICHLLQTSTNVSILHTGACNVGECQARKVCSTIGITYDNICELQSQAAVRVDYLGECVNNDISIEKKCKRVLKDRRCAVNTTNCGFMVFTEDGCCPICGGAIQLVIDEEALSDASESNPEMGTVDFFTILLLDIPEFQDISERCMVEVGLSTVGNLLIVFKRHTNRDGKFCNDKIKEMESLVNDQQVTILDGQRRRRQTTSSLPQVYDFVMGAVAGEVEEIVGGGAVRLEAVAGMVALLLLVTTELMF